MVNLDMAERGTYFTSELENCGLYSDCGGNVDRNGNNALKTGSGEKSEVTSPGWDSMARK